MWTIQDSKHWAGHLTPEDKTGHLSIQFMLFVQNAAVSLSKQIVRITLDTTRHYGFT